MAPTLDDWPTEVAFLGYFGPVALPDWEPGQRRLPDAGPSDYHLRVIFERSLWACFNPGMHDADPIDRTRFDVTALPAFRQPGVSLEEVVKASWQEWRRNGLCPDPGMYEVRDSPWIELHCRWMTEVGVVQADFKHVIIEAHDSFVEVVAKAWRYESLGPEQWAIG